MKNVIFVLYNKLSQRYGDVFCYPTEAYAVNELVKGLEARKLEENELCRIGSIDVSTGVVESCSPVRISWNEYNPTPCSEAE